MDIKGLDYNTQREKLIMPEYGREIQKMVDYACELPTKEERLQCARAIIRQMETKNPQLKENALLCPMLDARRMEVYAGIYNRALKPVRPIQADIVDGDTYKAYLDEHPVYFFGNGAQKCQDAIRHPNAHFIENINPIAKWMQPLAEKRFLNEQFEDVAYFVPFYLKDFVAKKPKDLLKIEN